MARNFLNYTGLQDYHNKIKNYTSSQISAAKNEITNNYSAADTALQSSLSEQITSLESTIPKNVYITIKVNTTEIKASGQSVLTLVAGSNITLTPDATNKKVTITATNTTYSVATASSNGLLSSTLFTKLNNGTFYTPDNTTITASSNKLSVGSIDASKITSGTINIDRLPAAALERCVVVANDTARLALTSSNIQVGDTVKVTSTKKMYMVIDATKLGTEAAFTEYVTSTDWSTILNKPDTLVYTENLKAIATSGSFNDLSDVPNYAGSTSKGGAANSAAKLTNISAIGSTSKPVYFNASGVPVACGYSFTATEPSNTTATTTVPTSSAVYSAIQTAIGNAMAASY